MPGQSKQQVQQIGVTEFLLNQQPEFGFNFVVGKKGTGKTTLSKHLAHHTPRCYTALQIAICGSEKVKKDWSEIIHPLNVHDCSIEFLQSLIDNQNRLVEKYGLKDFPPELEIDLYIDDCGAKRKFMHSETLVYLAANGKHVKINTYLLLQYIYMAPTTVRENADLLFVFATANMRNIRTLHDEYCSCSAMRQFMAVIFRITKGFQVLVLDNIRNAMHITHVCRYYKMPLDEKDDPTLLGSDSYRAWADKRLLSNVMKRIKQADSSKDCSNKNRNDDEDEDEEDKNELKQSNNVGTKDWEEDTVESQDDESAMEALGLDVHEKEYTDRFGKIIVRELKSHKAD